MKMKQLFKTDLWVFLSLGLLSLSMVACNDDDDGTVEFDPVAYVSLYQASPDAPALNIMADGNRINTYTFDYADFTGYLRFYTGERNLSFGPSGAANVVLDTTVTLEDEEVYSIFIAGEYPDIEALIIEDDAERPSEGHAMLRLINLAPDVPEIDLSYADETDALFDDQAYKAAPEFVEVSADRLDFEVKNASGDEVLLNVPDINLLPGYYYTFIVRGYQTPPAGNTNDLSAQVIIH